MTRRRKKRLNNRNLLLLGVIIFIYLVIAHYNPSWPFSIHLHKQKVEEKIVYKPENTIQIIEGWTLRDIGQYLQLQGISQSKGLFAITGYPAIDYRDNNKLSVSKDFSKQFSFLKDKPEYASLEGYLFPDTYRIYKDASAKDIVLRMLNNFDKKLSPDLREEIKKQKKSIYSIITMASIIEKEAPMQGKENRDARIISGIFWNRLKTGQALQSDATLSYVLNDKKTQHKGEDLEINSEYNTYKYRNLPPGPICNPSLNAIKAAIYPLNTQYNYFLTPKNSNKVIYARNYQEHLQNKYKYLK